MAIKSNSTFENASKTAGSSVKHKLDEKIHQEKAKISDTVDEVREKADSLYQHAKESASDVCEEGKKKFCEAQSYVEEQTDALIKVVREKPLSSLLIAGGIGFILSSLLRK